jgi:hypothetical protein
MSSILDAQQRVRNLLFLTNPKRWPVWPFLPLVRHTSAGEDDCGLLCDMENWHGLAGHRCTVFVTNLFLLPETLDEFLDLPKEVFDTFEELLEAGWRVD